MLRQASTDGLKKRTRWFPYFFMPVREGVYERDHRKSRFGAGKHPIRFSYWNGECWGGWAVHKDGAVNNRNSVSWEQKIPWRGLAKP